MGRSVLVMSCRTKQRQRLLFTKKIVEQFSHIARERSQRAVSVASLESLVSLQRNKVGFKIILGT